MDFIANRFRCLHAVLCIGLYILRRAYFIVLVQENDLPAKQTQCHRKHGHIIVVRRH